MRQAGEEPERQPYPLPVTTVRADTAKGLVSKESPVGKALLGRRAGDRVHIRVSDALQYDMVVRAIEKGEDDGSASIRAY